MKTSLTVVACCAAVAASAAGASSNGAAAKRSWYVDPGASGGAKNGTSWANAWTSPASIQWSRVRPGDTVYLSGGRNKRTYTGTMRVGATGAPGRPITLAASPDDGHNGIIVFDFAGLSPSATAAGITVDGNYTTISGAVAGANHLRIINLFNTSSGTSSAGVFCAGHVGIRINHVTFSNDNNPIRCTGATRTAITNNRFIRVRGDAAIGLAGSKGAFDSSVVSGNYVETVTQRGGYNGPDGIQNGSGVTIANNRFRQVVLDITTSGQHPDTIQNQGDNTKVYGNTFTNVGDSNFDFDTFADRAPHDIRIYNNVFRIVDTIDPYPDFIRFYHSAGSAPNSIRNFVVANNVFADSTGGSGVPPVNVCYYDSCGSPRTRGNRFANNIFVNDGGGAAPMVYLSRDAGASWTASHNVYYHRHTGSVTWKGSSYTAAHFVTNVDRGGSTSLPRFVNYSFKSASNNFHLRASDRVARNRGTMLAPLFSVDKDGFARPHRRGWDIGAYEWHPPRS